MNFLSAYKNSLWRVPLIAFIAGIVYTPLYVELVTRFGVIEPGVLDDKICLLTRAVLFLAVIFLGGILLLRKMTRKEILISTAVVVLYGALVSILQLAVGNSNGPVSVVLMYLHQPLDWTFTSSFAFYLHDHYGVHADWLGCLSYAEPFLFVLFGRRER